MARLHLQRDLQPHCGCGRGSHWPDRQPIVHSGRGYFTDQNVGDDVVLAANLAQPEEWLPPEQAITVLTRDIDDSLEMSNEISEDLYLLW